MERQNKKKKPPREGFRRRKNSYYEGMTKKQIAADTAKTALRWVIITAFLFAYWIVMLMLISMVLVNVWKVTLTELIIYGCILGGISSAVYAGMLVHRKFYY
ncbi:MAG: hypothetical protein IJT87_11385 [Ruminiclostridium sp.]|nr:hypothetical protein [Ruminiclostridium sp.]